MSKQSPSWFVPESNSLFPDGGCNHQLEHTFDLPADAKLMAFSDDKHVWLVARVAERSDVQVFDAWQILPSVLNRLIAFSTRPNFTETCYSQFQSLQEKSRSLFVPHVVFTVCGSQVARAVVCFTSQVTDVAKALQADNPLPSDVDVLF